MMHDRLLRELPRDEVRLTSREYGPPLEVPKALRQFWDQCGSGYYGGLALHVFGESFEESFHDIATWNSEALRFFRWLVPEHYFAFAEDAFGTQFLFDREKEGGPVYSLVIQDAVLLTVAESIHDFFGQLLNEHKRDVVLNYSFYVDCLVNDISHHPGQHLTLKVPRCLGGDEAMGLIAVDAVTNLTYLGQLLQQAEGLTAKELASRLRFTVD